LQLRGIRLEEFGVGAEEGLRNADLNPAGHM